jgi:hypothetical protein
MANDEAIRAVKTKAARFTVRKVRSRLRSAVEPVVAK